MKNESTGFIPFWSPCFSRELCVWRTNEGKKNTSRPVIVIGKSTRSLSLKMHYDYCTMYFMVTSTCNRSCALTLWQRAIHMNTQTRTTNCRDFYWYTAAHAMASFHIVYPNNHQFLRPLVLSIPNRKKNSHGQTIAKLYSSCDFTWW